MINTGPQDTEQRPAIAQQIALHLAGTAAEGAPYRTEIPGGTYAVRPAQNGSLTVTVSAHRPLAQASFSARWADDSRRIAYLVSAVLAHRPQYNPVAVDAQRFTSAGIAGCWPPLTLGRDNVNGREFVAFPAHRGIAWATGGGAVLVATDPMRSGHLSLSLYGQWSNRAATAVLLAALYG
jgi:hypothetical protein